MRASPLEIRIALHKHLDGASEISNFCHARFAESRAMIVFMVPEHRGCTRAAEHFMHVLNVLHGG
jgi:hypothetical protein